MKGLAERREECSLFSCFREGVLSVLRSREGGAGDTEERKEEAKCLRSLGRGDEKEWRLLPGGGGICGRGEGRSD